MTNQQKTYSLAVIGILVIVGLIWWGQQQRTSVADNQPIKIGVIAPLTGALADYGIAFKNGIELAGEELNNPNVEFIFEDSEYDPKNAISAFRKLTEADEVATVIDWGAPTSQAIAPLVASANVPFIAVTIDPSVTQASELIIRGDLNRPEDFAEKMWEYLRAKQLKNLAIVKTENLYLNVMLTAFEKTKRPEEQITIIDTYQFGDKDFRSSIAKIKGKNFDALGMYLVSDQISQFYRQSQELGLQLPTFGTDFFESESEIKAAGGTMNGAVYPNMDVSAEFNQKYQDRFGTASQIAFAGGGYDLARMLLKEVDYRTTETVVQSLKNLKDFQGVKGAYRYTETADDRYFAKPTYIKRIENGSIHTLNNP